VFVDNKAPKPNKPSGPEGGDKEAESGKSSSSPPLLDTVRFGDGQANSLSPDERAVSSDEKKYFNGPTRSEIKKLLNDYDRITRIDARRLFKWPIEVWVSCGEPFVPLKVVSKTETMKHSHRNLVEKAEHEFDKQSHVLRKMTGRRLSTMKAGQYKSVKNPDVPVVKEGHWSQVPFEEKQKQEEVQELKNYIKVTKNTTKNAERPDSTKTFGTHSINVSFVSSILFANLAYHGFFPLATETSARVCQWTIGRHGSILLGVQFGRAERHG